MPQCPECKKTINHLHAFTEDKYRVEIDKNGLLRLTLIGDVNSISFECPECEVELFDSSDEAQDFLKS